MTEASNELTGSEVEEPEVEALDWPDQLVLIEEDNTDAWIVCDEDTLIDIEL